MKTIRALVTFVMLALIAPAGWAETNPAPSMPEVTIMACAQAPVLDGRLDDACWQTAAAITNFIVFGKERRVVQQRALLTYDAQWLYVAFEIRHPQPREIQPQCLTHDGPIHLDDAVEIFLDPGTGGAMYYHYKLNAANTRGEQRRTAKGGLEGVWDVPWRSAAKITETGWNAEIAMPLSVLAAYGDLSQARLNLAIDIAIPVIDPQGVRMREEQEWLVWAPVIGGFHEPEHFGRLLGLAPARISEPFLPGIQQAKIMPYDLAGGQYAYGATVTVYNASLSTGLVNVIVKDQPLSGAASNIAQVVPLAGQQTAALAVRVPIAAPGDRTIQVLLQDPKTGEILQTVRIEDLAVLNLMSCYLDRSFYTTEPEALAMCALGLPASDLKNLMLVARDSKGQELGRNTALEPETRVKLDLAKAAIGLQPVRVELCRSNGDVICRKTVELARRTPKPGLEWKTDRVNRVLLRNGEPFFPFGVIPSGIKATNEAPFKEIAEAGFNSIQLWTSRMDPADGPAFYATAAKYGLLVDDWIEAYYTNNTAPIHWKGVMIQDSKYRNLPLREKNRIFMEQVEAQLDRVTAALNAAKEKPNMIGYYLFDEPCEKRYVDMTEPGRKVYRQLREVDGYHPAVLLYSSHIPAGDEYVDWCDILATDPYWVPGGRGYRGNVNFVSEITAATKKRGDAMHLPIWIVPVAEYYSGARKRAILPEEQSCQTYLALIHGAKGLFYFVYPVFHQVCFDALKKMAGELKVLGPIVVTPEVPQTVQYTPGEWNPEKHVYPDVQVSLRHNPAGGYVLLAANSRNYPVDVTYRLDLLGQQGKVGRLFDSEKYKLRDGAFEDRLEPFGVRAYTLSRENKENVQRPTPNVQHPIAEKERKSENNGQPAGAPGAMAGRLATDKIRIVVETRAYPEKAPPETPPMVDSGRPGKKNLLYNPGFEEATLPDMPDYYWPVGVFRIRTGNPGADYARDRKNPQEGKYCVRMSRTEAGQGCTTLYTYAAPKTEKPQEYVLSAWMRADRDGVQAYFQGFGFKKKIKLTQEWQRYYESGVVEPGIDSYTTYGLRIYGDCTVWVDAMQLEKGSEPTAFDP